MQSKLLQKYFLHLVDNIDKMCIRMPDDLYNIKVK